MPKQINAVIVSKWGVGYNKGRAMLMLESADRKRMTFAMPLNAAVALGRTLCELDESGKSTPHRPN